MVICKPFKVLTGTGPKVIVPNRFARELRNNPALNFNKAFVHDFFPSYPGMEPLAEFSAHDSVTAETIRTKLTQSLGLVTNDLVDETTSGLADLYGDHFVNQWRTVVLKQSVLDLIARLSSRVFLGKGLCREHRWLEIAKTYAVDAVHATFALRMVNPLIRPVYHWLMPEFKRCRQAVKDAHKMIDKEVLKRRKKVDEYLSAGKTPPNVAETIGWMHETAMNNKTKVDYVAAQLWPPSTPPPRSPARPSSTLLPTPRSSRPYIGPEICAYPEPERFDAWRFLKARERTGEENGTPFSGRFFAANEVKIALCHMLLKYDWRWVAGKGRPESSRFELEDSISATGEVQFRRRKEEINLDVSL
ncbi:ent-kaurene oxidase [Diaporthe helianthi]|uniref:Ent-kaurene oxidase n=1 Tax=Diaporthe helianthi TaxID=158607 RepID=A0A2P5IFX4_DIAHE|nr:ent-kaurene oxidase [Diaporthe helianthi]